VGGAHQQVVGADQAKTLALGQGQVQAIGGPQSRGTARLDPLTTCILAAAPLSPGGDSPPPGRQAGAHG
jgi:hypothetical protein